MLFNASSTASFRTLRFALPMLMALVLGGCQTATPPPVISAAFPVELGARQASCRLFYAASGCISDAPECV